MACRCLCCSHPRRAELDAELMLGIPLRLIAKKFNVSIHSAHRHRTADHIPRAVVDLMRRQAELRGVDMVRLREQLGDGCVFALAARKALLDDQLREVAGAGPSMLVAALAKEARCHDEALCRITGEVAPTVHAHVHALASVEWGRIRSALMRRARARPELRAELLAIIEEVEGEAPHLDGVPGGGGRLIEARANGGA